MMSKYDHLKILKETKVRGTRDCSNCGHVIHSGAVYYKEQLSDLRIEFLNGRKFCANCFRTHGDTLLK